MKKVFLDSSILVAASASKIGASSLILGWCRQGKIVGYVSKDAVNEASKNVSLKLEIAAQQRLTQYLQKANLNLAPNPPLSLVIECEKHIYPKDAPILAAALNIAADYLITLDKKHFLQKNVLKFAQPTKILLPGDFVKPW